MLRNIHYWLPNSTSVGAEQPHVEYESVAEIYDDGSYTVYDFANYHDTPDQFGGNPDILLNPDVYVSPNTWANNFLTQPDYEPPFRGTLLATSYYNSDNKLQKRLHFHTTGLKSEVRRKCEICGLLFLRSVLVS